LSGYITITSKHYSNNKYGKKPFENRHGVEERKKANLPKKSLLNKMSILSFFVS